MRTKVLGSVVGIATLLLAASACNKNTITPPSITLGDEVVDVTAVGGTASMEYEVANPTEGGEITVDYDETNGWASLSGVTDENISFQVQMNRTAEARELDITVSYPGAPDAVYTIRQASGAEYLENPAWSVSYSGMETDPDYGIVDVISVSGVSATDTYYMGVVTTEDFADIDGSDIEKYINRTISNEESMMAIAAMFGTGYTWADIIYSGSDDFLVRGLDAGAEYYAVIFGIDADGISSGFYAMSEAFVPEERPVASEEYSKWLGTWTVVGANGIENTIEITELVPNETYKVLGWQFSDYDEIEFPGITAGFSEEYGNAITFQTNDMGQYDTESYGVADLSFTGYVYTGDVDEETGEPVTSAVTGDYIAGLATMTGDSSAEIVGNQLQLTGGDGYYDVIGMEYFAFLTGAYDGYYLSFSPVAPSFPATMTKEVETGTSSVDKGDAIKFIKADSSASGKVFNGKAAKVSGLSKSQSAR